MSSRQMRRLQHLVDTLTGADADDAGAEGASLPATMKATSRETRKKGQKKQTLTSAKKSTAAADTRPAPPPSSDDGRMECEMPETEKTPETVNVSAQATATATGTTSQASAKAAAPAYAAKVTTPTTTGTKKKPKGKKHAAQAEEEDALLEAMLQQREREAAAVASDPMGPDTSDPSQDLLRLLSECDVSRLNTRVERVRSFGANAVEDYGDNLTTPRMPDGQPRDNGSHSLFPEHRGRFHFKKSAFASPNRYRWPPFDNEDTFLEVVEPKGTVATAAATAAPTSSSGTPSSRPLVFRLHTSTHAFARAELARMEAVEGHGSVQVLVDCLAKHGAYHVPTLLQLRETFQLMNDPLRAGEMVDVALYYVGILLSRFPFARTWRARQLPLALDEPMGNYWVHRTLWTGVHVALARGCMRTAFETNRCLLSLDPDDAMGSLLLLDYTALRAKRWVWLLEVFSLFHRTTLPAGVYPETVLTRPLGGLAKEASFNAAVAPDWQSWDAVHTGVWLCVSPGLAFSAALARHMLVREEAVYREEAERNPSAAKKPKVLKEMTAAQVTLMQNCPSAAHMFAMAAQWYPQAAVALVTELGGIETVCKGQAPNALWQNVAAAADVLETAHQNAGEGSASHALCASLAHNAELFAGRAAEMWRAPDTMQFLRTVLTSSDVCDVEAGSPLDADRCSALRAFLDTLDRTDGSSADAAVVNVPRYANLTVAHLRGEGPTALPADLLNGEADNAEFDQPFGIDALRDLVGRMAQPTAAELARTDHNALLRYRALYGVEADPDDQGTAQELSVFRARFEEEDGVRRYLGAINPVVLGFRALAPGNNLENLALVEALDAHGMTDPVREETAAHRARDVEMWEADDEEAWGSANEDLSWEEANDDDDNGYNDM